jgi:hypothetical protein
MQGGSERTYVIVKPDGVQQGLVSAAICDFSNPGCGYRSIFAVPCLVERKLMSSLLGRLVRSSQGLSERVCSERIEAFPDT